MMFIQFLCSKLKNLQIHIPYPLDHDYFAVFPEDQYLADSKVTQIAEDERKAVETAAQPHSSCRAWKCCEDTFTMGIMGICGDCSTRLYLFIYTPIPGER